MTAEEVIRACVCGAVGAVLANMVIYGVAFLARRRRVLPAPGLRSCPGCGKAVFRRCPSCTTRPQ